MSWPTQWQGNTYALSRALSSGLVRVFVDEIAIESEVHGNLLHLCNRLVLALLEAEPVRRVSV
jgi:hypothetical protein